MATRKAVQKAFDAWLLALDECGFDTTDLDLHWQLPKGESIRTRYSVVRKIGTYEHFVERLLDLPDMTGTQAEAAFWFSREVLLASKYHVLRMKPE